MRPGAGTMRRAARRTTWLLRWLKGFTTTQLWTFGAWREQPWQCCSATVGVGAQVALGLGGWVAPPVHAVKHLPVSGVPPLRDAVQGVLCYECLYGQPPFRAAERFETYMVSRQGTATEALKEASTAAGTRCGLPACDARCSPLVLPLLSTAKLQLVYIVHASQPTLLLFYHSSQRIQEVDYRFPDNPARSDGAKDLIRKVRTAAWGFEIQHGGGRWPVLCRLQLHICIHPPKCSCL